MLPKKYRLPLRTELKRVKKEGRLIQGKLFSLQVSKSSKSQPTRFGFIISSKIHKKAVKRNRVKRLLSETIMTLKIKPSFDVVFLAKKKIINVDDQEIRAEIKKLFLKVGVIE
ncbi:MAG TPA: ribonuclease P protein component [Patescibacteria group bacterium]|nr:ribonuclease P protein component [Patescibacteria group bacterium]